MPTYPTTPPPTSVADDQHARAVVQLDVNRLVRHVRRKSPDRLRRLTLTYQKITRTSVTTLLAFLDTVRGRSSRFDFTHPLTSAAFKARFVEDGMHVRQLNQHNSYEMTVQIEEAP